MDEWRERIRESMESQGYGLRELAEKSGIGSHSSLSEWLSGSRENITAKTLHAVSRCLGLDLRQAEKISSKSRK